MKQSSKQEAFRLAFDYACSLWKTGSMTINQATKLAAKQYKVNAKELAEYVFKHTKNQSKRATE